MIPLGLSRQVSSDTHRQCSRHKFGDSSSVYEARGTERRETSGEGKGDGQACCANIFVSACDVRETSALESTDHQRDHCSKRARRECQIKLQATTRSGLHDDVPDNIRVDQGSLIISLEVPAADCALAVVHIALGGCFEMKGGVVAI